MPSNDDNETRLDAAIRLWLDVGDADIEAQFQQYHPDFVERALRKLRFSDEMHECLERACASEEEQLFEREVLPGLTDRIMQSIKREPIVRLHDKFNQSFSEAMTSFVRFSQCDDLSRELKKQMTDCATLLTQFGDLFLDDNQCDDAPAVLELQAELDDALVELVERFLRSRPRPATVARVIRELEAVFNSYIVLVQQTPGCRDVPVDVSALEYLCEQKHEKRDDKVDASNYERRMERVGLWPTMSRSS